MFQGAFCFCFLSKGVLLVIYFASQFLPRSLRVWCSDEDTSSPLTQAPTSVSRYVKGLSPRMQIKTQQALQEMQQEREGRVRDAGSGHRRSIADGWGLAVPGPRRRFELRRDRSPGAYHGSSSMTTHGSGALLR